MTIRASNGTRSQRTLRSTLAEVAADTAAAGLRSPAVVVVGEVVAVGVDAVIAG